jgi:transglutaminase-like putative cysteine protease
VAHVPPGLGDGFLDGAPFIQRITVEAPAIGLLPAAVRASTVQLPKGRLSVQYDGALTPLPPVGKGTTYVVTSFLPSSDEALLRATDGRAADASADLPGVYLSSPGLPDRVLALAAEITTGAPTPYDKAAALEAWLATNTEAVAGSRPLPGGADPIDQFLVDRRGSNEQAATAMAVILRSLGIPSRLAVGYVAGQRSAFGGEFVVRARHAHAWVEAWFPGPGWVAFDPTGRAPPSPPERQSFWSRLWRLLGGLVWVVLVVAVAALAWAGWKVARWYRKRHARPWATRCYERLTRAGRQRGRPRHPAETPAEYCQALADDVPDDRLLRVGELLTVAAYSDREPPPDDRAWADAVVRDVERAGAPRRRSTAGRPG